MSAFFSPALSGLVPYTPGEQPQDRSYIKLNTNESPYPPSPGVIEALNSEEVEALRLYSDPEARELKRALAEQYGVEPEQVFVSNGSDEALNFAVLAFATDGRGLAFADITYGFYPVFAALHRVDTKIIPLRDDFRLAAEDYEGLGRTILIANPNAPTGLALCQAEVERIVSANPDSVVIVDEAYVDFGAESAIPLVNRYSNLLVVQTFSKSRSMAGARLGYAVGSPELVRDLETIKFSTNPYNVNRLTLRAGTQAVRDWTYFKDNCRKIVETRAYTKSRLEELGFFCTESKANFLFARHPRLDGAALYQELKKRGVLIRHFDGARIRDYNRITIGTREQMELFLSKVRELL